jgi:endo-1,4-beta-xylanase
MKTIHLSLPCLIATGLCALSAAEPPPGPRAAFGRPIVLEADDKSAFEDPPAGFKARREGIPHGKLELVEYDSKTVGTTRRMQVYTPPGYSKETKYPVLYLLHGIGGDENEWQRFATVDALLDNLIADKKAEPMIVVMPNGRAQKNDRPEGNVYSTAPAFAAFERDLLDDVIPAIESKFSVKAERESRALAGLSMGGGQALNFGLGHLDTFAWVGGFSSAPNTKAPKELVPDLKMAEKQLKLLWLSCGNKDGLINISQGVHRYLRDGGVPHLWHVDGNGHDPTHWSNCLYFFAQKIFREPAAKAAAPAASAAPAPQAARSTGGVATLREAFADDFLIGAAVGRGVVSGRDARAAELVARQFSALTAENDMKWQSLHPAPDRYDFNAADDYLEFAKKHRMTVIGHTLVWHSQTPDWVFKDEAGKPVTREVLLKRMKDHIQTVVGRYKGRIKGWDVVNEALSDGGREPLRDSPWRRIIGDDFIEQAFRFAHEADPQAELYYNDYGLENGRKRDNAVALVKGLLKRGVPITGIGTQSHFHLNHPPVAEVERTLKDFAALGVKVMVTELDVDVLPSRGPAGNADISRREQGGNGLNPYPNGLPPEIQEKLAKRYGELFEVYLRHRKSLTRVTFWGVDDGRTWLNGFPIRGRTNHPLLFDRDLKPKPAFDAVLRLGNESRPRR